MIQILVVDDEEIIRSILKEVLEPLISIDIKEAVDGADGLEALLSGNFGVVITDMDMPQLSGLEMVKAFCSECPEKSSNTTFIGMSGRLEHKLFSNWEKLGFAAAIKKPFTIGDLRATLVQAKLLPN